MLAYSIALASAVVVAALVVQARGPEPFEQLPAKDADPADACAAWSAPTAAQVLRAAAGTQSARFPSVVPEDA